MAEISVIMGIYNCEATLAEAIDSILAQTHQDWQLILCDDGSDDGTYAIAQRYQQQYPKKLVLLQNTKNMGLSHALNRCLACADGKYIARMDGDDISLPQRFAQEAAFLDAHPEYAIVSTPMIYFDENGEWGVGTAIEKPEKQDFIHHSPVHCHAPCMIRREAYLAVEGYTESPKVLRFEDVDLWYKLYAAGFRGYNFPQPLYKMRDDRAAAGRRSLCSRMNGVYVTAVGFRRFGFAWYRYGYVALDFAKHFIKGILPQKLYQSIHKRRIAKAGKEQT